MKFGSWQVTDKDIEWASPGLSRFTIPLADLLQKTDPQDSNPSMYQWILLATEEDWLTVDDLYDLSFAFAFAAGKTGAEFDYDIFDQTLSYQYDLLDSEEEEQPDFGNPDGLSSDEQQRKDAFTERD